MKKSAPAVIPSRSCPVDCPLRSSATISVSPAVPLLLAGFTHASSVKSAGIGSAPTSTHGPFANDSASPASGAGGVASLASTAEGASTGGDASTGDAASIGGPGGALSSGAASWLEEGA